MRIKDFVDQCQKENPCELDVRYDEPMSVHTTFKVGGPADCWLRPKGENFPAFCRGLFRNAQEVGIPVFVLGGGANIVVSDKGIRGIVLDTTAWKGEIARAKNDAADSLVFRSGTTMDEATEYAAAAGFSGLEFLAGMPGTIGGAVYMNARCYGREIADVLAWTDTITKEHSEYNIKKIEHGQKEGFGYKLSPFQGKDCLILSACFNLKPGNKDDILHSMEKNRQDRKAKGHYDFPCAGSAFKNNHDFGKPTGQIIDELGLKGFGIGGAQIAPFHGNIVINKGGATALDITTLMSEVATRVKAATGFVLEPEIIFTGL
jgi:UDP-N-acetylmuramate dehydrogenase